MSRICDTCSLSNGCRKPIGGVSLCSHYVRAKESNYERLFGTPERAARTLENGSPLCDWCDTNACEKRGGECSLFDYDALLKWLKGGSDGE